MASRSSAAKKAPPTAGEKAELRVSSVRSGRKQVSKGQAPKARSVAGKPTQVRAAPTSADASLSDAQLLALARSAVPKAMRDGGVVVRRPARATLAMTRAGDAQASLDEEVAAVVGATLPAAKAPTATVEFESETALGKRNTVVHVRGNEVTRVITRAAR